jgi:DNA-binding NarL/FixJ family response regulator
MNSGMQQHGLKATAANAFASSQSNDPKQLLIGEAGALGGGAGAGSPLETQGRVIAASRHLQDLLLPLLAGHATLRLVPVRSSEVFRAESLVADSEDLLLLECGNLEQDVALIRKIRGLAMTVRIVMLGGSGDEREFLQYVRAGIQGYLLAGASGEEIVTALQVVHAGKAFCPSSVCGLLFQYFEREATRLPSAAIRQRLGLTRREQQLVPLIGRGMTNRQIANQLRLSEQTVKNHLYRMKHKVGAGNRLDIVQTCHNQGFLL